MRCWICFALAALAWAIAIFATPAHALQNVVIGCTTTPALSDVGFPVVLCDSSGRPITSPFISSPSAVVQASSGNVANATAAATIPAVAAKTNFLEGVQITAGGATAGQCVNATVVGLLGGTITYTYCSATGAGLPSPSLVVAFNPPLPASAVNTAITLSVPALGTGNTNAAASIQGFVQ